jgi:hypothetical protein
MIVGALRRLRERLAREAADITAICECGHWRLMHKWWCGCLAFSGKGICTCPCFRRRR